MKTLINIIFVLFILTFISSAQTFTNGVYVKNDGITIEVDKKFHQITNSDCLLFSNELTIETKDGSDLVINSFFQEVNNLEKPPHFATFGNHSFSATLMKGEATVIYNNTNENSACLISTPMCDIQLQKGIFYFKITEDRIIVFSLTGSFIAHYGKKSKNIITSGYAIVGRKSDIGILESDNIIGAEKVKTSVVETMLKETQTTQQKMDQITFIIINGKIIGVNKISK